MNASPIQKPRRAASIVFVVLGLVFGLAQESVAEVALPAFNVDIAQTSVSGLSSGGYMAVQFNVAFSSLMKGASIVAGGPYYCAHGDPTAATSTCSCTSFFCGVMPGSIDVPALIRITDQNARQGRIDPTSNLAHQRIWLFSGRADSIVPQRIMDALLAYYANYIDRSAIVYKNDIDAEHAMPTDSYGNPCDTLGNPFINDCAYDAAGELLNAVYGQLSPRNEGPLGGDFIQFDQAEFLADPNSHGMDTTGWLYVPNACRRMEPCRLHIAFHGCKQYQSYSYFQLGSGMVSFGTTFVRNAGYNKWADSNGIVVLYPQATATPLQGNPEGCWDWWGYDDQNYATKNGRQISAVYAMIQRIASGKASTGP